MIRTKVFLFGLLLSFMASFSQESTVTFLALGDSYTIGTGEDINNNWPNQFTQILFKKGYKTESKILAAAGWTTEKLLMEIKLEDLQPNYDLVSLLIGVNNQYRGMDFESFKKDFTTLLDKCSELVQEDNRKVMVLSIPDWSVTPFARFKDKDRIVTELKAYNTYIKEETEKRNMLYIEITKQSRNAEVNPALLASDSLHPSKKMYKLWAKKISKMVLKELN